MKNVGDYLNINRNIKVKTLIEKLENSKKNNKYSIAIKFYANSKKVEGVLSLGDLRRLVYNNKHNDYIYKYLNRNPYYLPKIQKNNNIKVYENKLRYFTEKDLDDIFIYDENKNFLDI